MRGAGVVAAALAVAAAAASAAIAPFSSAAPGGDLPPGWRKVELPRVAPAGIALASDEGRTVLRVQAAGAASSAAHALDVPAEGARLAWRWKVDRVVAKGDLARREGDDYAARVYVMFDVPLSRLPFAVRARIRLGRLFYGTDLPAAALCYVWDNRHPPGTTAWNAYSDQVRMVVVESGAAKAGRWVDESRDLAADFRAAFGERLPGPLPRVSGIALSADTDQTGETVTAWFGDVRVEPAP